MSLSERAPAGRRWALAAAVVAAAAIVLALAWPRSPPPEPRPPAPPVVATRPAPAPDAGQPGPPEPAPEAVVAAVSGKVERLRDGNWASIEVGERLQLRDSIRALPKSKADLDLGPEARLTLAEDSELKLAELSGSVHRVRLERGRVTAAYAPQGERVLRIEDRSGQAVAEARAARFSAMATDGAFVVATETGKVNLSSGSDSVEVAPGEESIAKPGATPSAARPIPVSLLLKVAAASRPSGPCRTLDGSASPGSEVFVEDTRVAVGPDGRFSYEVEDPDRRQFRVVTRDATGRTTEKTVRCRPPAPPPKEKIDAVEIRWHE